MSTRGFPAFLKLRSGFRRTHLSFRDILILSGDRNKPDAGFVRNGRVCFGFSVIAFVVAFSFSFGTAQTPRPTIDIASVATFPMPDVSSKCVPYDTAAATLNRAHDKIESESRRCAPGQVFRQVPRAGVNLGLWRKPIVLYVVRDAAPSTPGTGGQPNSPAKTLPIPDFVGKDHASAEDWLRANRRKYRKVDGESSQYSTGTVFAQYPKPDTDLLALREAITIFVSTGPPANNTNSEYTNSGGETDPVTNSNVNTNSATNSNVNSATNTNTGQVTNGNVNGVGPVNSNVDGTNTNGQDNGDGNQIPPTTRRVPWEWLLAGLLLPISGATAGQIWRHQIWKKRISADVSIGGPSFIRIGSVNPVAEPIGMNVSVLPGDVRFAGPIKVTEVRGNDAR